MVTGALIWTVQFGLIIYVICTNADWAGVLQRLRDIARSPVVWALAIGCMGFLYTASSAMPAGDYAGASFGLLSFVLQALTLAGVILRALFRRFGGGGAIDLTFGSAEFATPAHAAAQGLLGESGLRLGYLQSADPDQARRDREAGTVRPLHYDGPRHVIVMGPTRSGKFVSFGAPAMLGPVDRSVIMIDIKAESVAITAAYRAKHAPVFVIDPWKISGYRAARFNPLAQLRPNDPSFVDDVRLIAQAIVHEESGDGTARHFADQATMWITGGIGYVVTDPSEAGHRTLGRVRDILTATPKEVAAIGAKMARSPHPFIVAAAVMMVTKAENERAGILSTAQRHTHFLDSPAMRESLAGNDLDFAALKSKIATVYVCLPVDRLVSHGSWLRLLVELGITIIARTPSAAGQKPCLLIVDEAAALGKLEAVETAYGLTAGMGLQLVTIFQDISQIQRVYGAGWQTLIANTGALLVLGTRDLLTAEYVSKLIGVTTRTVRSTSDNWGTNSGSSTSSGASGFSSSSSSGSSSGGGISYAPTQRPLLFPDELMRMPSEAQIVFVENANPILARKITYYDDPRYKGLASPRKEAAR